MSTSCLGGILGWFWSFVKNFFEGHTSPPPRSTFAPPAPLCNEPGYFDRFTNLLCVSLLQYRNTCFYVATSVKNSVFGVRFWRGGFVYILRKWIFYFTAFSFYFIQICCVSFPFDSLVNVPRCHVAALSSYHVDCGCSLKCCSLKCCGLKCWRRATLFALEDLETYHVVKLFCGWRFCSCWGIHRRHRQLVVNTFKLTC